jgi:hypothetical protein
MAMAMLGQPVNMHIWLFCNIVRVSQTKPCHKSEEKELLLRKSLLYLQMLVFEIVIQGIAKVSGESKASYNNSR